MLDGRAVIAERDTTAPDSFFDSISPLGWLRRAMSSSHDRRYGRCMAFRPGARRGARLSAFPWRG